MDAMHRATLSFDLGDPGRADAVLGALAPEVADGPEGTTTAIRCDGTVLHADLEAQTVSGLRAALNGVVRLLDAAMRTL